MSHAASSSFQYLSKFSCWNIFPKRTKTKAARVLISWLPRKFRSLKIVGTSNLLFTFCYTAETESEIAEKSNWDQVNRGEKLGLVWRNRKKISQIINDYLLHTVLLLILCYLFTGRDAGSAKMALLVPKGIARYPDTGDSVKVCIITRVRFQVPFSGSQLRRYRLWQWIL
jgi:hypothetical protein